MTDDERITEIADWNKNSAAASWFSTPRIDFLLRVIQDQRAELIQARQAILNMRQKS